jgi:hypothetical protein
MRASWDGAWEQGDLTGRAKGKATVPSRMHMGASGRRGGERRFLKIVDTNHPPANHMPFEDDEAGHVASAGAPS